MKFYSWLNEENNMEEVFDKISKNCKPFLKNLTSNTVQRFLVSGRRKSDEYFKGTIRKDRQPTDTPEEIHDYVDNLFDEKFGIKARSSTLFCMANPTISKGYGTPYLIFPIGKYKLIWSSDIEDFFGDVVEDMMMEDMYDNDKIEDAIKTYEMTEKIPVDVSANTEIMLYCKEYYALKVSTYLPKVVDWLEREYNANIILSNITYRNFI